MSHQHTTQTSGQGMLERVFKPVSYTHLTLPTNSLV